MIRGFHLWQQTRWPGRNGRVRYAHTLFNLYVIRCLELLSMRLWDAGASSAGDRLSQVQGVLDQLWTTTPADQPVLVRDARWLIQLAQSPATDDLGAYFDVAEQIAETLSEAGPDRDPQGRRSNGCRALAFADSLLLHEEGVSLDEHEPGSEHSQLQCP